MAISARVPGRGKKAANLMPYRPAECAPQRWIFLSAKPLWAAMCSVLSLLISYCGLSLFAWCVKPLNEKFFVCTLTIVPRTRPASEFQLT